MSQYRARPYSEVQMRRYNMTMTDCIVQKAYKAVSAAAQAEYKKLDNALAFLFTLQDYVALNTSRNSKEMARLMARTLKRQKTRATMLAFIRVFHLTANETVRLWKDGFDVKVSS